MREESREDRKTELREAAGKKTEAAKSAGKEGSGYLSENSDFTRGSIPKKLILFMLPVLGALVLQAMYGAVDLLVVGRYGSTAGLSGVSTGSQVLNLITFMVSGSAMSITVLISRYLGEQKHDELGPLIGAATVIFSLISAALFVLLVFFAEPLAALMQAPAEAKQLTADYIRICGAGIFFIVAYNLIAAIYRGLGDSNSPLLFVGVACAINVVGDLLFVAVLGMNVAGAALATVLAQALSVVFSLVMLRKKQLTFRFRKRDFRLNEQSARIVKIGLPLALQELLTQSSFVAICAFVNRLGLEASSGYGVASKLIGFIMLVPSALMQSLESFVSMNVGAGDEKRAEKAAVTGVWICEIVGVAVFFLVLRHGDLLSAVFTADSAVIAKSFAYLKGFAPEVLLTPVLFAFIGYYNGHEATVWSMVQGLLQVFLVRLPFSFFMSIQPDASLRHIGYAAPLATAFGILINAAYLFFYRKKHLQ